MPSSNGLSSSSFHSKVSVILSTYNHEKFIGQAINSTIMQDVDFPYEIVIIEDCSSDGTQDIVIDYQKRYPNTIRLVLAEKNQNDNRAWGREILKTQSQYIALLDGDDYWTSPDKLQKQVNFLDRHPECAICFHAVTVQYEDTTQKPWISTSRKEILTLEDLLEANFIRTCSTMFRSRLFDDFPEWYYVSGIGDWELHIFNAQHGSIGYIDDVMGVYRVHKGGVYTSSSRFQRLQSRIEMYSKINHYFKFKYNRLIKKYRSRCMFDLAREYAKVGDLDHARQYLIKSLFENSFNRYISYKAALKLSIALYMPRIYKCIS